MPEVLELAAALIARRSVTPDDAGCQALIASRLERAGFRCEHLRYGEVSNLWAAHGDGQPVLCLAGHTDVVPSGPPERWSSDPFVPTVREGVLFGRGAADMKSSLAAMTVACERFVARHPTHRGSIGLLITSDEEGPATDGTRRVVETLRERGQPIDWCLVGEPTSATRLGDTLRVGRRGSLTGLLTVHGIQGHVAYPELVRNPIHASAPAFAELAQTRWDEGNAYFPPTSFQISNLSAGTGADNVVPGTLQARFNFRHSTAVTPEQLQQRVAAILDAHGLEHELDWMPPSMPYLSRPGALLTAVAAAVTRLTGVDPQSNTRGGTSDGRFIATLGAEVVELGPVNESIHKIDEHVRVSDLEPLAGIYHEVMRALLATVGEHP